MAGNILLKKGESLSILLPQLHRDKAAWGEDSEEFRPERFEDSANVPHHAYKPFGNGERACIGMQFALYEATLVLGMVIKQFQLIDDSNYKLDIKQTLTLKPGDFKIKIKPRLQAKDAKAIDAKSSNPIRPSMFQNETSRLERHQRIANKSQGIIGNENTGPLSLLVLYGSNLGTSEGIARNLSEKAINYGITAQVAPMNEWKGRLPQQGIVIVVTASYNGKPPHNAASFMEWLETAEPLSGTQMHFAVLGCGDRNWSGTYQSVPRFVDERLAAMGGTRLCIRGEADAGADLEQQVTHWERELWAQIGNVFDFTINEDTGTSTGSKLELEWIDTSHSDVPLSYTYGASEAKVLMNVELQAEDSDRSTRHIEVMLPEGMRYREGDHLGVLPQNSDAQVGRVLKRYALHGGQQIKIASAGNFAQHLPYNQVVTINDLLGHCVELQWPASRAQLREIAGHTVCPPHKRELEMMLEETRYNEEILRQGITMLDLLEKYEACELPFAAFLALLPPLKPRYYSISSSPRHSELRASITVSVVREPAWNGKGEYRGVASTYLSERQPGDRLLVFVHRPESGFALPEEEHRQVPIIMVGPGTGVAPFRGFLQDRSILKQEGKELGEAYLFFGCRNERDRLYREELEHHEREGNVKLFTAFSRDVNRSKTYVQDLMKLEQERLIHLLVEKQARIYVCGDGRKMAPAVESTLREAYQTLQGASPEVARGWIVQLQAEGRYLQDVWASKTYEKEPALMKE